MHHVIGRLQDAFEGVDAFSFGVGDDLQCHTGHLGQQAIAVHRPHLKAVLTHWQRMVCDRIGGCKRAPLLGRTVPRQAVAVAHLPRAGAEADALEVNANLGGALGAGYDLGRVQSGAGHDLANDQARRRVSRLVSD